MIYDGKKIVKTSKTGSVLSFPKGPAPRDLTTFLQIILKMCEYMLPHGDKRFQCQGWLLNSFTMHEKWKWDITIKQTRHTYCKCQSFQNKCSVKSAKHKGVKQRDYFLLISMDVANTFFRCNEICFQILTRIGSHLMY